MFKLLLFLLCLSFNSFAKPTQFFRGDDNQSGFFTSQIETNYYSIDNSQTLYGIFSLSYSYNGFETALSTTNIPIYGGGAQNYEFDSYLSISKTFYFNHDIRLTIQNQTGLSFDYTRQVHQLNTAYLMVRPFLNTKIMFGPYYVNAELATNFEKVGFYSQVKYYFTDNIKLDFTYYSGHNNVSGGQASIWYYGYYVGVLVPEQNSGNEFAGVLGMKYVF